MSKASLIVLIVSIIGIWSFVQVAYGATSTTTIFSSQNPSTFGQPVTFTANISPSTATGSVQFEDTTTGVATVLGSGIISGGIATFSSTTLSVGSHSIVANYLGDASDTQSSSSPMTQVVNQISSSQSPISSSSPISNTGPISNQQIAVSQFFGTRTITIDTIPRVASLVVDNTIYLPTDLPLQFIWNVNSKHTIAFADKTIKNGDRSRYIFDTWTDESKQSTRTLTVKDNVSLRALLKIQNYLTINSDFGKVKGAGWYDAGSVAQFSISQDKVVDAGGLHQHLFDGWSGGDNQKSMRNSITVDNPITINANWKDQYYIQLASSLTGISVPGSGWYNNGDQVPLITDKESPISADTKYVFGKWAIKGDHPSIIDNPNSNTAILTVNGPQTIEADYQKSYLVSVFSTYGYASGGGYYTAGSTAAISISSNELTIQDQKQKAVFNGWSGSDIVPVSTSAGSAQTQSDSNTATSNSQSTNTQSGGDTISVMVNKPLTLYANWKDQFYLDVSSKQGTASGSGWYDSGQSAQISVTPPAAPPGVWVKYVFDTWSGDYQGHSIDGTVVMNGPKSVLAQWKPDYTPAIMNSVIMSAVAVVGVIVYRKMKKNGLGLTSPNGPRLTAPSDRDEITVANEIYQDKQPKKSYYQRYDVNPTEYQYYLFSPRKENRF